MRFLLGLLLLFPLSLHAQSLGSPCRTAATLAITGTRIVNIATEAQLQQAMGNLQAGDTLVLADGTYTLSNTLYVSGRANVTIRGAAGCDRVVLVGRGMDNSNAGSVPFGIWSNSPNTTIAHLTIRGTWDNPIIFNAGASSPRVYNAKILDAGSQFIKSNPDGAGGGNDNGIVEHTVFEYLNGAPAVDHGSGTGYWNGLSLHTADNWIIRDNLFKNLHSPDNANFIWNPAVLVWNRSIGTVTERNIFLNVDRAIAYGLG
ncbi:MAG: hypothetical protein IT290_12280, partial [Deltaproteobacteria bacterium]|nr:hypothetical protein [Deltaproteobacteria bacterium]